MRPWLVSALLCASVATASTLRGASLHKRDNSVCTDLSVSSNNGDRKVAIVLDSSGSMSYNDPYDLRIAAGRALTEFLISNAEASGNQKADMVTVIDFDDSANLDYPLGDPAGANASFDKVDAFGGTYIASGINLAIQQLTGGGGSTDKRSAIVVFTDGEDSSADELVAAIGNATAAGIRVSFGFLDTSASSQPTAILEAIRQSRGVYATITVAAGSQNFINYCLLNGLTYNDNPQGYDTQLLAGLSETHFVSNSDTVTLKYSAQQGENVNFTVTSISAGALKVVAQMNGQTLSSSAASSSYAYLNATAPSSGELDVLVTASNAPKDSMFSIITNSNVPFKNCTVGVSGGGNTGLSSGAKAGLGVGITAALLGMGALGGYFAYKHFMTGGNSSAPNLTGAPSGGDGNMTSFGAEKFGAHTTISPVDPGSVAPGAGGQGYAPMSAPPNGYEAHLGTQPVGDMHTAGMSPNLSSGMVPNANLVGGSMPPTGVPPTGSPAPFSGSAPMAFVPPMVPPQALAPSSNNATPNSPGSKGVPPQSPQLQNTNGYQSPMSPNNAYQNPMGPNNAYQHLGSGGADGFQQSLGGGSGSGPASGQPMSPGSSGFGHPAALQTGMGGGEGLSHGLGGDGGAHNLHTGYQPTVGGTEGAQPHFGGGDGGAYNAHTGFQPPTGGDGISHTLGGGDGAQHYLGGGDYNAHTGFQPSAGGGADGLSHGLGGDSGAHNLHTGYQPTVGGADGTYNAHTGFQPSAGGDGVSHTLGGGNGLQTSLGGDGGAHGLHTGYQPTVSGGDGGAYNAHTGFQPSSGGDGLQHHLGGGGDGSAYGSSLQGGNATGGDLTGGSGSGFGGHGHTGMNPGLEGAHSGGVGGGGNGPHTGFDGFNHTGTGGVPAGADCVGSGMGGGAGADAGQAGFMMPGFAAPMPARRRRSEDEN